MSNTDPKNSDPGLTALLGVLAALRGMHHLFSTLHWQAIGPNSYSDHLLYERLYKAREEEIDQLAERLVGLFDARVLHPLDAWTNAQVFMTPFVNPQGIRILDAEKAMLTLITQARNTLAQTSRLSTGTDNLLGELADAHETALYLLRQRFSQ